MRHHGDTRLNPRQDGPPPPAGWVLYDASCGLCRGSAARWGAVLRKRGFGMAALQEPWVAGRLGLPPERVAEEFRLLLPDGRHLSGPDAYRHAARRVWWLLPLWGLAVMPGTRRMFDRACRAVAGRRMAISTMCRIK